MNTKQLKRLCLLLTLTITACVSPTAQSPLRTSVEIVITPSNPPLILHASEAVSVQVPTASGNPTAIVIAVPNHIYVLPNPSWTATPVPQAVVGDGYLWFANDFSPLHPGEIRVNTPTVVVIGPMHQNGPESQWGLGNTLDQWIVLREACKTVAPAAYRLRTDVPHPDFGVGVEVLTWPCRGFVGWVYREAIHNMLPH